MLSHNGGHKKHISLIHKGCQLDFCYVSMNESSLQHKVEVASHKINVSLISIGRRMLHANFDTMKYH